MKKYIKPEIEIIKIDCADVIATSGDPKLAGFKSPAVEDDTLKSLNQEYGKLGWNTQY